ncbi:hypothetical protein GCM10027296_42400 [Chitinimonas naiadis]
MAPEPAHIVTMPIGKRTENLEDRLTDDNGLDGVPAQPDEAMIQPPNLSGSTLAGRVGSRHDFGGKRRILSNQLRQLTKIAGFVLAKLQEFEQYLRHGRQSGDRQPRFKRLR